MSDNRSVYYEFANKYPVYRNSFTNRQWQFCIAYLRNDGDFAKAYAKAFSSTSKASARVAGSVLANKPHIRAFIKYVQAILVERAMWTRDDSVDSLKEALGFAKDRKNAKDMVNVVSALNRMHGYDSPTRIDITSGGERLQHMNVIDDAFSKIGYVDAILDEIEDIQIEE